MLNVNEMGGTLDQSSEGFTVDVPPGAVITDTELTFTAGVVLPSQPPEEFVVLPEPFLFEPGGATFDPPLAFDV